MGVGHFWKMSRPAAVQTDRLFLTPSEGGNGTRLS